MSIIKIISAMELPQPERDKIEKVFQKKHAKSEVEFEYEKDVSLIGGVLVIDGNDFYDATIKGQMNKIKQNLN